MNLSRQKFLHFVAGAVTILAGFGALKCRGGSTHAGRGSLKFIQIRDLFKRIGADILP
jgi:hypothetical protein